MSRKESYLTTPNQAAQPDPAGVPMSYADGLTYSSRDRLGQQTERLGVN